MEGFRINFLRIFLGSWISNYEASHRARVVRFAGYLTRVDGKINGVAELKFSSSSHNLIVLSRFSGSRSSIFIGISQTIVVPHIIGIKRLWPGLYTEDLRRLKVFDSNCLRYLLRWSHRDCIPLSTVQSSCALSSFLSTSPSLVWARFQTGSRCNHLPNSTTDMAETSRTSLKIWSETIKEDLAFLGGPRIYGIRRGTTTGSVDRYLMTTEQLFLTRQLVKFVQFARYAARFELKE